MSAAFTFGLTFDPADKPAKAGAMREGPQRWRGYIGGVRDGSHFYDWQSAETFPTCAEAMAAAEAQASGETDRSDAGCPMCGSTVPYQHLYEICVLDGHEGEQ